MVLTRSTVLKLLTYTLLILGAFISLVPFVYMISTSLKTIGEALGTKFFPSVPQWGNYVVAWERANFSKYFFTSLKITGISLVGGLSISILAAYGFARIEFPGRELIFGILLSTMMIPAMVTIIPNFLTVTWLGRIGPLKWINN
ncbi:MAG: carbohydrate ABC transporter permease, partial [Anaerolineales bacterium]